MDENAVNEYGWVIIVLTVLTILLAFAPVLRDTLVDYARSMITSHF